VTVVRTKLDVALFGIDVIVERATGRFAIIDMNLFPGYDGVDNFLEELTELIFDEIQAKKLNKKQVEFEREDKLDQLVVGDNGSSLNQKNGLTMKVNVSGSSVKERQHDIDSGIDTSDSCDEKKNKTHQIVKAVKRQHSKSLTTV
jgi:inositol-1,3,4-trisphosphate 5/6-kinase/inositol-tetrakisphosphate 1-kinase